MRRTSTNSLLAQAEDLLAKSAKRRRREKLRAEAEAAAAPEEEKTDPADEETEADAEATDSESTEEKKSEEAPAGDAPAAKTEANAKAKAASTATGPKNGGFHSAMTPAAPKADLGEHDLGYSIPPELADVVKQTKEEAGQDSNFAPGISLPQGLEDIVMSFVDPDTLLGDEPVAFDMIPFMPEGASTAAEVLNAGAHWVLCANGDPLAKITLKDQDNAGKIAGHFVSADYARSVIEGIQKHGLQKTMEATKAKPYVAKVNVSAKVQKIQASLAEKSGAELRAALAKAKSRYLENINLVLTASANNFIVENPLKNSLIAFMGSLGIPEQVAAEGVDNSWFQHGAKTLAGLLTKSEEWSNFAPEALAEVKAAIEESGRRQRPLPSAMSPAAANPHYDANLANRIAANAIPAVNLPTSASVSSDDATPSSATQSAKDKYRARFGGFGR